MKSKLMSAFKYSLLLSIVVMGAILNAGCGKQAPKSTIILGQGVLPSDPSFDKLSPKEEAHKIDFSKAKIHGDLSDIDKKTLALLIGRIPKIDSCVMRVLVETNRTDLRVRVWTQMYAVECTNGPQGWRISSAMYYAY